MLFFSTFLLFLVFTLRNIFFWVGLWQLKEYRLDRLSVHLRDTEQGRKTIFSFTLLLCLVVIGVYFVGVFSGGSTLYYPNIVFLLFLFFCGEIILDVVQKKIKRPQFTVKAVMVSGISFLLTLFIALTPLMDPFLWLFITVILTPFFVAFVVFLFAFPTEIYTDIFIQKAKEKRKKLKRLQVIAVSGSYGKSSTKEIIAYVLSQKFHVVKTNFSQNTALAIAKTLLHKVDAQTDFFIVELGAYKKGEIKQLAEMVSPTISVTTAISDQHLALYGKLDDVIASELELIQTLPKQGFMLLNKNSQHMTAFAQKIKRSNNIIFFQTSDRFLKKSSGITAFAIKPTTKGVQWTYQEKDTILPLTSSLLGEHTVENILPAVFLARHFGIADETIQKAIAHLPFLSKTMQVIKNAQGVHVIDDTFNASPESVASALAYVSLFKKKKHFVLSPLIELGKMSKQRHFAIGQAVANLDTLYVTNNNFLSEIKMGIASKNGKVEIVLGTYKQLAEDLQQRIKKGDVVVFEGKEAGIVLQYFL